MSRWDELGAASQVDEIAALIAELDADLATEAVDTPGVKSSPPRFRLVVATDWSSAVVPLAVLRGYAHMLQPGAPTQLVFAVPHDPSEADLAAVRVLFEGLGDVNDTADLTIESFDEAANHSCYAAIVPQGDADALVMELTQFFVTMHQLAYLVTDSERLAVEPHPSDGPNVGLRRRLAEYRESSAQA